MDQVFEVAAGSIPGRSHVGRDGLLVGKNNQDAYAWRFFKGGVVAIVTDGCSAGAKSEIGAELGARFLVRSIGDQIELGEQQVERLLEQARRATLEEIKTVAHAIGSDFNQVVNGYFLFTVLGVLILGESTYLFSCGDGLWTVNGELCELGPFEKNRPPYIAYDLIPSTFADRPELLRFTVTRFETEQVRSVVLATDGAKAFKHPGLFIPGCQEPIESLSQFWGDERYVRNRSAIRRRLTRINSEVVWEENGALKIDHGRLDDDTTILVIRRKETPWRSISGENVS